jgi:tRNA threonylcarbamoyl adenosine modification protein (Sua5/YciO/YrdC/YwlC family)
MHALQVPLAVCVASVDQIPLCGSCQNVPEGLLHALLPGPVTIVLPRHLDDPLSRFLNPGITGMAIRVPAHGFIQQVVQAVGSPIVLTSANKSGEPSTTAIEHFLSLWGLVDGVFDGGEILSDGKGSTIVDLQQCADGMYRTLRDGSALVATTNTLARFGLKPDEA